MDAEAATPWAIFLSSDWFQAGSGKMVVNWSACVGSVSIRRDFLAVYELGQQSMRKYIEYKAIEKEGLVQGVLELTIPSKPGDYVIRYLRADYTVMATSHPITARSALTVLLDEVKTHSARGDAESVVELLETVMLHLKKNDDTLHRQALESWQEQQSRKARPGEEGAAASSSSRDRQAQPEGVSEGYSVKSFFQGAISKSLPMQAKDTPGENAAAPADGEVSADLNGGGEAADVAGHVAAVPVQRPVGLQTVRVRGTGCYAQGKLEGGDARGVWVGGKLLVGGDSGSASGSSNANNSKKAAGLWLLVLRLENFEVLFSCLYDTHHDSGAADRFAADMATHALERDDADPERVLVIVTSQYSWEGYFSSAVLCERLARCGAKFDRLIGVQRNNTTWMKGTQSQPYVLIGIPGRRGELRFSVEACNPNVKTHCVEVEVAFLFRESGGDPVSVGVRFGTKGEWAWALPTTPSSSAPALAGSPVPQEGAGGATHQLQQQQQQQQQPHSASAKDGGPEKHLSGHHVPSWATVHCSRPLPRHASVLREAVVALVDGAVDAGAGVLRRFRFAPGQLKPLSDACLWSGGSDEEGEERRGRSLSLAGSSGRATPDPEDEGFEGAGCWEMNGTRGDAACALAKGLAEVTEGEDRRERVLDEALSSLILMYEGVNDWPDAARLDSGRALCNVANDPALSLHSEVVKLTALKDGGGGERELQRVVAHQVARRAGDADGASKIMQGAGLEMMLRVLGARGGREGDLEESALLGLRNLSEQAGLRVELIQRGVLDAVIPSLGGGQGRREDAVRALGNLCEAGDVLTARVAVSGCLDIVGVAVIGWWQTPLEGTLCLVSPVGEKGDKGGGEGGKKGVLASGCNPGCIAVLQGVFTSKEQFLSSMRACQAAGAAAAIFTASTSPLPLLAHMCRDAADMRMPSIAVRASEMDALLASCASNAEAAIGAVVSSRLEMESRALPLLRSLSREGKGGLGLAKVTRRLGGDARRLVDPRGVRVLCLDGGGIRGLVLVELLRRIELETGRRITELFDVVCGTSTGGLVAVALLLGKSLDQVQACYHTISNAVFKKGWFSAAQQLTYTGAKYDGRVLEDCLRDEHGDPNLLDTPSTPRTFVVSTMSSVVPAVPFLWRNYAHTLANPSRYLGTCNACTVTALRATSAAPSYFDDVVHDGARHIDGALAANNPTAIAIHEAQRLFPGAPLHCVVSLATGTCPVKATPGAGVGLPGVLKTLIDTAISTAPIADVLRDLLPDEVYYRFSPEGTSFGVAIDQTDKAKIEELMGATQSYVALEDERFARLGHRLMLPGDIAPHRSSSSSSSKA